MALDDQFLEQAANVRRDIDKYYLEGNLSFAMNSREFKVDGSSSTSKTETTEFMLESKLGFSTFLENAHIGPVLGIRSVSNDDAKSSEFEFYGGGFIDYFFYDQDMFRVGGGLDLLLIYASTTTGSGTSVESSNTGFGFGAFPNLVALVDVFEGRAHLVGRLGYEIASVTLSNDSSSGGSSAKTTVSDGNIVFKVGLATSF